LLAAKLPAVIVTAYVPDFVAFAVVVKAGAPVVAEASVSPLTNPLTE